MKTLAERTIDIGTIDIHQNSAYKHQPSADVDCYVSVQDERIRVTPAWTFVDMLDEYRKVSVTMPAHYVGNVTEQNLDLIKSNVVEQLLANKKLVRDGKRFAWA